MPTVYILSIIGYGDGHTSPYEAASMPQAVNWYMRYLREIQALPEFSHGDVYDVEVVENGVRSWVQVTVVLEPTFRMDIMRNSPPMAGQQKIF